MGTNAAILNLGARPPRTQANAPSEALSKPIWLGYFILSAGGILLAGALVRFLIAAGNAQVLALPEPLLPGLPLRYAVLAIGAVELVVALICLFGKRIGRQLGWLAGLATIYVVFWVALVWQHCAPQGTCIGSLTDPLRLARGTTGLIIQFIPVYLLLGSYTAVIWLWFGKGAVGRAARLVAAEADSANQPRLNS